MELFVFALLSIEVFVFFNKVLKLEERLEQLERVKQGRWDKHLMNGEPHEEKFYDYEYECSVCGGREIGNLDVFCPWCGAKMKKEGVNNE